MKVLTYKPSFPSLYTRRQSNGCELGRKSPTGRLSTLGSIDVIQAAEAYKPGTHRVTHLVLRQHSLLHDKAITIPVAAIRDAEMDVVYFKIDKDAVEA
jgi:hypothetical protein